LLQDELCFHKPLETTITGPTYYYRRSARLSVKYDQKKQRLIIGFREFQSRFVTHMSYCHVLTPGLMKTLANLRSILLKLSCFEAIPQLSLLETDNAKVIIIRHLKEFTESDLRILIQFSLKYQCRLYSHATNENIRPICYKNEPIYYNIKNPDLKLFVGPETFIQVNKIVNQKIIEQSIDLLQPSKEDIILDLFCGVGNITLPIAKYCHTITGIEISKSMTTMATHNAKFNNLNNATFIDFDLYKSLNYPNIKNIQKIIVDPPRSGIGKNTLDWIISLSPNTILYISCNPETLIQDCCYLKSYNFEIDKFITADMFPQTHHIECIALIKKIN
jgi:23S rRNA (uracil1939-C5)-methyltransferase